MCGWIDVFACCDSLLVIVLSTKGTAVLWDFLLGDVSHLVSSLDEHNCSPLCTSLTWLGLLLDSSELTVALPSDKVAMDLALVRKGMLAKSVTRQQLDSLFELLSFCCVWWTRISAWVTQTSVSGRCAAA